LKIHLQTLIGLMVFAVAARLLSFFPSVINHDESTYLVIAQTLLQGYTYFVDYIDTKPPGIFWILAGFLAVFGKSIVLFRAFVAIIIATTAFGLYLIQLTMGQSRKVALGTALIYILLSSLFTFYGISPNTETFFNCFTVFAFWLVLSKRRGWTYLLAGFLLGAGFMIKYVVVFDAAAFGVWLLWEQVVKRRNWGIFWGRAFALIAGFLIVPGITLMYYHQQNTLETWWFHSVIVSSRYPELHQWQDYFIFPMDFFLRFLPVTLFYLLVLRTKRIGRETKMPYLIWSGFAFFSVMLPGNAYGHYFIQFMLPFSLLAGLIWSLTPEELPAWMRWIHQKIILRRTLVGFVVLTLFFQYNDYLKKPDYPKLIANYLQPKMQVTDNLYTGNGSQILYLLLNKKVPNKYVHPSLFWEEKHLTAMEIDIEAEVGTIQASRPKYVIIKDELWDDRFDSWLETSYHLDTTFREGRIKIMERND
jgi:4-amino-4-deoxy-L-arabinose transferase-like glycosyltransferase